MSSTIAYLDCHSGISGDMFLGAMLDAGLSLDTLKTLLATLPVSGYQLTVESFTDKGICGRHFAVQLSATEQPTRHLSDITALLHASALPVRIRNTALAIFQRLLMLSLISLVLPLPSRRLVSLNSMLHPCH